LGFKLFGTAKYNGVGLFLEKSTTKKGHCHQNAPHTLVYSRNILLRNSTIQPKMDYELPLQKIQN
jgi:hypothetical protein